MAALEVVLMRKFGILGFVIVAVAAACVIVMLTPVAHGQTPTIRRGEMPPGSIFPAPRGAEIGVSIRDVVREDVATMKLSAETGAVIEDVRSGGPADTAGLRKGDVAIEFDGEKVRSAAQLTRLVRETPAGRRVKVTVLRDGRRTEVELVPAEPEGVRLLFNTDDVRQSLEHFLPRQTGRSTLGITTQEMTPELTSYFGAKNGVVVTSVIPDSPAEKGGIKVGDVISEVAGNSISSSRELIREVQNHQGEIALKVVRDKKELTLKVTPPARTPERRPVARTFGGF
jgi:serine protease Do